METKTDEEEALQAKEAMRVMWFNLAGKPYIPSNADLQRWVPLLAKDYQDEFCWSTCFKSEFVASLMYEGFLPMAVKEGNIEVLFPKLHVNRCLVPFSELPRPHRSTMKKAKRFQFKVNTHFTDVAKGIVRQHGENWFYPKLVRTFIAMNEEWENGWLNGKVRVHSFELWLGDELVAGEAGYSCGTVYTSLSGFTSLDSAGTIQMHAMASYLKHAGFEIWDLGMHLGYKQEEFAAKEYPRLEFMKILHKYREKSVESSVFHDVKVSAHDLLKQRFDDVVINTVETEN